MSHIIYVAHPIDQVSSGCKNRVVEMMDELETAITAQGHIAYWPRRPWQINRTLLVHHHEAIIEVNQAAQKAATATVALLPKRVPTLGVPAEIERALTWGQPVAIVADPEACTTQVHDWRLRGAKLGFDAATAIAELPDPGKSPRGHVWPRGDMKVLLGEKGKVPTRTYQGDAGYDLHIAEYRYMEPGRFADVLVDCAVEMPDGMWAWIVGRSSTLRNRGLLVNQGIIDAGWRGRLYVGVKNIGQSVVELQEGDRIAQLIPMPLLAAGLVVRQVETLSSSDRGTNGFGSTGR